MLFYTRYKNRADVNEDDAKRTPPEGYEFKAHYSLASGDGGLTIVETDSAETMLKAHAPWSPFFEFEVMPLVEIADAVPIFQATNEWRDSI